MFQYLPHHRRFCDEPNQAHAPAAPAALERKHPVDRASNCAHKYRAGCPACVAPKSVRTVFGRDALLTAPSFRPACATNSARHGELGASTPK